MTDVKDVYAEGVRVGMELGRALATGDRVRDVCKYERACQRVMQLLGPEVSKGVDYGDPDNFAGLEADIKEALDELRKVGIEYQYRRPRRA